MDKTLSYFTLFQVPVQTQNQFLKNTVGDLSQVRPFSIESTDMSVTSSIPVPPTTVPLNLNLTTPVAVTTISSENSQLPPSAPAEESLSTSKTPPLPGEPITGVMLPQQTSETATLVSQVDSIAQLAPVHSSPSPDTPATVVNNSAAVVSGNKLLFLNNTGNINYLKL